MCEVAHLRHLLPILCLLPGCRLWDDYSHLKFDSAAWECVYKVGVHVNDLDDEPMEGVGVCAHPAMEACATSDANGFADLQVPCADDSTMLHLFGDDLANVILLRGYGPGTESAVVMTLAEAQGMLAVLGTDLLSTAVVGLQLEGPDGGLSGVRIEAVATPTAEVVYFDEGFLPDRSLDATSSSGVVGIVGLESGEHDFLVTPPAGFEGCDSAGGWPMSQGVVQVPTQIGMITTTGIRCQ